MSATIVLDIGKTNVKLVLLDDAGAVLAEQRSPNTIVREGPYPHHDTERIWKWMLDGMRDFAQMTPVGAIVPVTHGATAALVDEEGLVLPVLDYEYELPMVLMNRHLHPEVETIFLVASQHYTHVSSSLVKEVFKLGGAIDALVPTAVSRRMKEKIAQQAKQNQ